MVTTDQKSHLRRIYDAVIALIGREGGPDAPSLAQQVFSDQWVVRGASDAVLRLRLAEHELPEAAAYAFAYATGAKEAVLLARVILSDPAVRDRELEALKLIEEGADHAAVVARLRAVKPACKATEGSGNVIPFGGVQR